MKNWRHFHVFSLTCLHGITHVSFRCTFSMQFRLIENLRYLHIFILMCFWKIKYGGRFEICWYFLINFGFIENENGSLVDTRCRFDVYKASIWRLIDVETTSYIYWVRAFTLATDWSDLVWLQSHLVFS